MTVDDRQPGGSEYTITNRGQTFQRVTAERCPRCGNALSLMDYGGVLTLACENEECGRNGFYWRRVND